MIRKLMIVCLSVVPIAVFGMTPDQSGARSQTDSSSIQPNGMQVGTRGQSIQLDPLIGQKVMDSQQKELGQVQDVVVCPQSQKALFVILGSGGFLGVGEDYHAIPWSALQIQKTGDTIQSVRVSTNADIITNSPKIDMGAARSFDSSTLSEVNSYYQGKGVQTDGMTNGMKSSSNGVMEQYPSNGQTGSRPSGMTGTSSQNRQFNTAQPQTESIYGNGVRSGQERDLSTEPNDTTISPFGTNGINGTNGTEESAIPYGSGTSRTSTQYRSGYAEGIDRSVTQDSTSQNGMTNGQKVSAADSQFIYFSDLSGRQVNGPQNEQLGSIEDLVVDAKQGNILFSLISMDDGMVAVPWSSLHSTGEDTYSVSIEKDTLRSLAFKSDNKPDFSDPSYQQSVYQRFGQQPPTVFGYVSPEGTNGMTDQAEQEYTKQFDAQKIETVSGEVKKIEKDSTQQPMTQSKTQKSMCFSIETDQGRTMKVYGAPEQFLKDRGLELSEGDNVQITGSRAQVKGEEALIASKISKDNKEVIIRSAQGQPMWQTSGTTGSQMRSEQPGQTNGMSNGQSGLSADEITGGQRSQTDSLGNGMANGQTNGQGMTGQSLLFNAAEQTTVSGTVQSTDSGRIPTTMDEAVLFKVQTSDGQTATVYAGPRSYLQQQNMSFSTGDKITATGWKKTIGSQEVFIASKIEKDGQTLQLRDSSGKPQWKQEGAGSLNERMESQRPSGQTGSGSSLNGNTTTY